MSAPRILFLIRHGRADYSSDDFRTTPRGDTYDPPLDEIGREQAELLARRLLLMDPPGDVWSSPFRRARETAEAFASKAGIDVEFDEDLGEAFIGEWENKSFEEILESDEEMLHRFRNQDPIWSHAPGAEAIDAFRARVRGAAERILARHTEGNAFVFCHGGVINAYLAPILGLDHEMFFLPDNASLNSVLVDGDERCVRFLNDVRHLTEPHLFGSD